MTLPARRSAHLHMKQGPPLMRNRLAFIMPLCCPRTLSMGDLYSSTSTQYHQ
jgi:hypothetical protein